MDQLSTYSFVLRTVLSVYMNSLGVELFTTRTVHEILWGFKDPLLTKIHNARPQVDEYFGLMWKVSMSICAFYFWRNAPFWRSCDAPVTCEVFVVMWFNRSEIGLMLMEDASTSCLHSNVCNSLPVLWSWVAVFDSLAEKDNTKSIAH